MLLKKCGQIFFIYIDKKTPMEQADVKSLFSRRTLAIVNLDDMQIVKKVPRQSKWEISAAEWNPHPSHADHFITAVSTYYSVWYSRGCSTIT